MAIARHTLVLVWLVAALPMAPRPAGAEPRELPASVVWARADRIYIAAPDSGVLVPGMSLAIMRGRRQRAAGTITHLLEARLAVAQLSSGSLAREKRLDRLRVRGEPPAVTRATTLRVGLPGRERANLLFSCASAGVARRLARESYVVDTLGAGDYRLRRAAAPGEAPFGPDTLMIRFFAESADQEIALERGELDVAVFWPGELSARMRAEPRWRDAALGVRAQGVLACLSATTDSLPAPADDMAALNRDVFGGDLMPWAQVEPPGAPATDPAPARARYEVDPALPGARLLERVLARASAGAGQRTLRLAYLDVPVAARDSALAAWRTRGLTPVFAVRCPVLALPAARPVVRGIGADAFANLVTCASGGP